MLILQIIPNHSILGVMLIFPKQAFFSWLYSPKSTFFVPEGEAAMEKQSLKRQEERIILHARFTKNRSTSAKKRKQIWNELVSDKKNLLSSLRSSASLFFAICFSDFSHCRYIPLETTEKAGTHQYRWCTPESSTKQNCISSVPVSPWNGMYRSLPAQYRTGFKSLFSTHSGV